ncbi:MAG: LysR substrate-binding domain-containing protein [Stellaceae bacterium]
MIMQINLDMDVLRTLVAAQELGGLNRAARRVGRSQSAVSQQLRKLEEQAGQPLFRKQGRGLCLTEAGDVVLRYARRILELNDEAIAAVQGTAVEGVVRFGMPSDFAETWLPAALGRFKRAHPSVRIEASVDRNAALLERLETGHLDLVLLFGRGARADAERLATVPMVWIGREAVARRAVEEPLPLVLFEPPCVFREAAVAALEAASVPWRVAFTSPSLSGLWAAVDAGLGVTVRTAPSRPPHLAVLDASAGWPDLPLTDLSLHNAGRSLSPATSRLKDILLETVPASLAAAAPRLPSAAQRR